LGVGLDAEKLSIRRSEAVHREIGDPLDAGKSGIQKDHIISENLDPQLSLGMTKYDPVSVRGGKRLPQPLCQFTARKVFESSLSCRSFAPDSSGCFRSFTKISD
jgi:hypothetical protein